MSSVALLVGANPSSCFEGPSVRLLPGLYTLHIEGLDDSILALDIGSGMFQDRIMQGYELILREASDIKLWFQRRGSEKFINVFAHRQ